MIWNFESTSPQNPHCCQTLPKCGHGLTCDEWCTWKFYFLLDGSWLRMGKWRRALVTLEGTFGFAGESLQESAPSGTFRSEVGRTCEWHFWGLQKRIWNNGNPYFWGIFGVQPNKWVNSGGILVAPANMKVNLDDFNFSFDCGEYWRLRYVVGCFVFVVLMLLLGLGWTQTRHDPTWPELNFWLGVMRSGQISPKFNSHQI